MRRRPVFWIVLGILLFSGAALLWRGSQSKVQSPKSKVGDQSGVSSLKSKVRGTASSISHLPSSEKVAGAERLLAARAKALPKFKNRLSNTEASAGELSKKDHAILLQNALFDTEKAIAPKIPAHLKSAGDPGSYIVQSKTAIDNAFRDALKQAGAAVVPDLYIPNNALMIRASKEVAQQLAGLPQTQAVLPFEPYYKFQTGLLDEAVKQNPLPDGSILNVLVFADAKDAAIAALNKLGAQVLADERSYFGHMVKIVAPKNWTEVARLPGVQVVEMSRSRVPANDLSRVRIGVATDTITNNNYLNLTGQGVLVAVNDTGVDALHPDLTGRVFGDFPSSLVDSNGHGTHVAGIIASSGNQSSTVTNASGSRNPGTNFQYRGIAPAATILSMAVNAGFGPVGSESSFGPLVTDSALQEGAARTNALISNNSWHYFGDFDYDLGAVSYDAAVRDSLPGTTGSQPIIYVFAAGNAGGGDDNGQNGGSDSILSPATAKNIITVGAIEQFRFITNITLVTNTVMSSSNTPIQVISTNRPWQGLTDSSNQVARFSSRGNVGIGIEGDFGRFKPDVVAPGTFVVSTTEKDHWDQISYYDPTNHDIEFFSGTVPTNSIDQHSIFIPANAVQFVITVFPPNLAIYLKQTSDATTNSYDVLKTNRVTVGGNSPDWPLNAVDTDWFYAIGNTTNHSVDYTVAIDIVTTNNVGNYFEVLSNLNNNLGPYYRYESGTSMSAADVSGTLALMQQYFQQLNQPQTNSPALMKALLINGARSVAGAYDFQVTNAIDYQGWGLINIRNSLQTNLTTQVLHPASMLAFDQSPTNALATGQRRTYHINAIPSQALRVTLAWTDPPGNPFVGTKLVNNLDLVVTNLDVQTNPVVYLGNDIPSTSTFNVRWNPANPPNVDAINNVENVYLLPGAGSNFTVTVIAKNINVNAVTAQTNEVEQDYALVISSGNGQTANALQLTEPPSLLTTNVPQMTVLSNQFDNIPGIGGGSLNGQRAGASIEIPGANLLPIFLGSNIANPSISGQITIGTTNGWHFYTITNTFGFTNAAFLISVPTPIAVSPVATNFTRFEADVDLYVSTNSALTNLDPVVIAGSDKSLTRGGTETVILTNAQQGLYYAGVKSEDQEAAEYSFIAIFSQLPFSEEDPNGQLVRGLNVPIAIPDGTTERPGVADIIGIAVSKMTVKRVIVTNVLTHELTGDLFSTLRHTLDAAVVNNHSGSGGVTNQWFIYDDSGRNDIVGALHTDPPGNLTVFGGKPAQNQWHFIMEDNAPTHTGTNVDFKMYIERQQDPLDGITITLPPGGCDTEYLYVPVDATNLTVIATITAGSGPVTMDVCPIGASGGDCASTTLNGAGTNSVTIDKNSNPPLNEGTYTIHVCNNSSGNVTIYLRAFLFRDANGVVPTKFVGGGRTILDDAVTYSPIKVSTPNKSDPLKIVSAEVGVRIDHPRVSDLVMRLISPDGTRMLLQENRGGLTALGMGTNQFSTNIVPVNANGDWHAQTNIIALGIVPTLFSVSFDFFNIPDYMHIYYGGNLIYDSGLRGDDLGPGNGQGTFSTNLPGPPNQVVIVMNEGNTNTDSTTAWTYTVTSTTANYIYTVFTEDTNKTITPIKFAIPPFVTSPGAGANSLISDFEGWTPGDYIAPQQFDGWTVLSSSPVTVTNNPAEAHGGSQYLSLNQGRITRTLPTTSGHDYILSFSAKGFGCSDFGVFNTNDFNVVGDAVIVGSGDLQLTPASANTTGGGWARRKQPLASGFDTTFVVSFPSAGPTPGEGMTFTIQNDSPTNNSFFGPGSLYNNVSVFFNTHLDSGDISGNSVGILTNTGYVTQRDLTPLGIILTNGQQHFTQIISDGNLLNVLIDGTPVLTNVVAPLAGALDACGQGWVGFSATCSSAAYEIHDVGNWNLCPNSAPGIAQIYIPGQATNVIITSTNWTTNTFAFSAKQSGTPIEITASNCSSSVLLDDFVMAESFTSPYYVLPEDPYGLSGLKGTSAIGDWQLEIWDNRAGPPLLDTNNQPRLLSWDLSFVFATPVPVPIPLVHDEESDDTIRPKSWQYYAITVPSWASFGTNILLSSSPAVDMWFNQSGPPTSTNTGDIQLLSASTGGSATLTTNAVPPPLPPLIRGSTYYIGLYNPGAVSATVSFKVDFDVTPLTNGIPVASPADPQLPRFFSYDVTNGETGIAVLLTNLTGNADLVVRKTPFPDLTSFDYGSFNPGTNDEDILIYTNSDPVVLSAGNWYFGVFNRTTTNVDYSIVVIDVPRIIQLFNASPYTNSNAGGILSTDYYFFHVSPNSVRAQFEILNPSGDMTLVARKGMPPADMSNYNYISSNPNLSDELITVFDTSTPVPLSQGDWFISAINVSGGPVTYAAMATEWPVYGTNIIITNVFMSGTNSFCLTWTSVAGIRYWVGGRTNIMQTDWTNVSPTVTATGPLTTWCLPLPSQYQFFRVFEGLAPGPPAAPFLAVAGPKAGIAAASAGGGAFTITWPGQPTKTYKVQWTSSLTNPNWQTFSGGVTSSNGTYSFTDQSAASASTRFYRIVQQ